MYRLPQTLSEDISRLGALSRDFEQGKIEAAQFKITRVPMGIYEQRKDGVYMVRIRTTGGVIHPDQLLRIVEIAENHHSNLLHITTRQEIQIQNLELQEVEAILNELQVIGLSSKGGGGNTVRNILVSVDSGITTAEAFDPTPHAMALTTKLIAENDSFTLPRKLKIAFAIGEAQTDYAAVNDIGFVAKVQDGKRGFKVYVGGSVASRPTVGWVLFDFIPESEIFIIVEAVKQLFSQHGNRKNKHKARLRHIFYRLGAEETLRLFGEYYEQAKASVPLFEPEPEQPETIAPYVPARTESYNGFEYWKQTYTTPQKQRGFNSVIVPFIHGNIDLNNQDLIKGLKDLLSFIGLFGRNTIRFSTQQNIHLRNIPDVALLDLYHKIKALNADVQQALLVNNIVSCTGADTCRLGICLSKGLAGAVRRRLQKSSLDLNKLADLRIQISGCPNSCGQQVWADLGFSGKVLRNDRMYPAYQVFAGASRGENPALAAPLGDLNARNIPALVEELLGHYLQARQKYADFKSYLDAEGKDYIQPLMNTEIPDFEEDKNYYFDWGADEVFSVANRGVGECSAGLFDMIDLDLKYIDEYKQALQTETDKKRTNQLLHDIVYSASRMLLITRGLEPKNTEDIFDLFIKNFIEQGLVNAKFADIVSKARDEKNFDFSLKRDEIYALAGEVTTLYQNMDDSLQFKASPSPTSPHKGEATAPLSLEEEQGKRWHKDLRGVLCPMNFVQTKIQLASMKSGELLEILLDDGQPIANVPGSVRGEGHQVLEEKQQSEGYWRVLIKKK